MNCGELFLQDLERVISDKTTDWEKLRGTTILVTGATGGIGHAIVRLLAVMNANGYGINVIAVGRNAVKGEQLVSYNGVKFLSHDIRTPFNVECGVDYIIHCAAVTKSSEMVTNPVGVIDVEILGGRNTLEFAREKAISGMVYTSSMEVYGIIDSDSVRESDAGYIDVTSPRSCYPQAKRMVETMCGCYAKQYDLPIGIVRLGQTFGASCDIGGDQRVYAQFARKAMNGEDIVLHTEGRSVRSFVYLADALKAIMLVLLRGENDIYNVSAAHLSICALAQTIANAYGAHVVINKPADITKFGYNSDFNLSLNCDKIRAIGWIPAVGGIEEMFKRTINDYKETRGETNGGK